MSKALRFTVLLLIAALAAGCEAPDPNANTPTSGRLILFVDELYAPLVRALADSFMVRSPNAKIDIQVVPARTAIEKLVDAQVTGMRGADTTATMAAIVGRGLIGDESEVVQSGRLDLKEYDIAFDGVAIAVPITSTLQETTLDRLVAAMRPDSGYVILDDAVPPRPVTFLLPDQNSSTFMVVRSRLLKDSNITAPVQYFSTSDSVVAAAAEGKGIAVISWYRAHLDSARLRALKIGFTDSVGIYTAPVPVHPATLVTGAYPVKQPLKGFTFAPANSLAVGFLAWISRAQDAQFHITRQGLQGANVKYQLNMPASEE